MKRSSLELDRYLTVAVSAAEEAAVFLRSKFGRFKQLDTKPNDSLVTEADRGAERLLARRLKNAFPHHGFLGEEGASRASTSAYRWIVDPLDGTTNFVHGFPFFCVSVGLERDGEPVVGAILNPISGEFFTARLGGAARLNKKPISVSKNKFLKHSLISTGFSYEKEEYFKREVAAFTKVVRSTQALRRTGSAALDLCYVACGRFEGFYERGLSPWDVTAGVCILNAAGGHVTDFAGKEFALNSPTLVATNGKIHKELVSCVAQAL